MTSADVQLTMATPMMAQGSRSSRTATARQRQNAAPANSRTL